MTDTAPDPPTRRVPLEIRKEYFVSAPFVRVLSGPRVSTCKGKGGRCKRNAKYAYRPIGTRMWVNYCWTHVIRDGAEGSPEDYRRLQAWHDSNPAPWETT